MSSDRQTGDGLRAAAAAVNITPALGCALAGYGNRDQYADDIADGLYSKVLALECGGVEAVIVTNDLIGIPRELAPKIRRLVREATGVPEGHVLVCASHTHFGPVVEDVDYLADSLDGRADRAWIDLLTRKIAGAAAMARRRMRPARLGAGKADAGHICYNRRTIRPDGKVEMSWRLPPPGSELSFGPKDPEVGILKVEGEDGELLAVVANFGCHAVCGGENHYAISADYPGYMMKIVERERGGVCLFTAGGAGNVVPLERGGASRKRIGEALSAAVLSVLDFIPTRSVGSLRALTKPLRFPLKPLLSVEEAERAVEAARKQRAGEGAEPTGSALVRAKHDLRLAKKFGQAKEYETEVQAIGLGDTALLALPGEVFCEITMAIKKALPDGRITVVSLANDCPGYVPDELAYDQGGYEPEWTPFARGADAALIEAGRDVVRRALAP